MRVPSAQIKEHVLTSLRHGSNKSGQPLIYGVSAALEVAALKARHRKSEGTAQPEGQACVHARALCCVLQVLRARP